MLSSSLPDKRDSLAFLRLPDGSGFEKEKNTDMTHCFKAGR